MPLLIKNAPSGSAWAQRLIKDGVSSSSKLRAKAAIADFANNAAHLTPKNNDPQHAAVKLQTASAKTFVTAHVYPTGTITFGRSKYPKIHVSTNGESASSQADEAPSHSATWVPVKGGGYTVTVGTHKYYATNYSKTHDDYYYENGGKKYYYKKRHTY